MGNNLCNSMKSRELIKSENRYTKSFEVPTQIRRTYEISYFRYSKLFCVLGKLATIQSVCLR